MQTVSSDGVPPSRGAEQSTVRPAVWPLVTSVLLIVSSANSPAPLYALWGVKMGFTASTESTIFACYNFGVLVSLLTFGGLVASLGPRKILIPALSVAFIADLCFLVAPAPIVLEVGRLLIGLAAGAAISATTAAIQHNGRRRGMVHYALIASLAVVLGFGCGPFISGLFANFLPMPLHLIFAVLMVLIVVQVLVLMALPGESMPPLDPNAKPGGGIRIQVPSMPRNLLGTLIPATMTMAGPFAAAGLFISIAPNMLEKMLHMSSPALSGFVGFLVFGAGAVAQVAVRSLHMHRSALLGIGLTIVGLICVTFAQSGEVFWLFCLSALLTGFGQSIAQLAAIRIVSSTTPATKLPGTNAAFFLVNYLFGGLGVLVLGFASDQLGLVQGTVVFDLFCVVLMLIGVEGSLRAIRREKMIGTA